MNYSFIVHANFYKAILWFGIIIALLIATLCALAKTPANKPPLEYTARKTESILIKDFRVTLKMGAESYLFCQKITNFLRQNGAKETDSAEINIAIVIAREYDIVYEPLSWLEISEVDWLSLGDDGYILGGVVMRKPTLIFLAKNTRGASYAFEKLRSLAQKVKGGVMFPLGLVMEQPRFQIRGVVEGFYGQPWSDEQRLRMFAFFRDCRFNLYIYAPKEDEFHRKKWRLKYPGDKMASMSKLITAAQENQLDFCFAVSPGNSIKYSSKEDCDKLVLKYLDFQKLGVHWFGLFLDDIPKRIKYSTDRKRFNSLAEAQAYLANNLYTTLLQYDKRVKFLFCPTEYRGITPSEYVKILGEKLQPDIMVMWTGRKVCSPSIMSQDAQAFGKAIRRKPFIWDNYPVNDYKRQRLFLGAVRARSNDLHNYVSGFVANPMNESEASKIPLLTIADYLWDASNYNPESSWESALKKVAGDRAYPAFRTFAGQSQSSFIQKTESPKLARSIKVFWEGVGKNGYSQAAATLRKQFQEFALIQQQLSQTLDNPYLIRDITPYLEKLSYYGEIGIASLELMDAKLAGETNEKILSLKRKLDKLKRARSKNKHEICGKLIDDFVNSVISFKRRKKDD